MTPREIAGAITGVFDDGGLCTPNSKMGVSRQIAQAIDEVIRETQEKCARIAEGSAGGWNNTAYGESVAKRIADAIRKAR